jgi:hypothetical protein
MGAEGGRNFAELSAAAKFEASRRASSFAAALMLSTVRSAGNSDSTGGGTNFGFSGCGRGAVFSTGFSATGASNIGSGAVGGLITTGSEAAATAFVDFFAAGFLVGIFAILNFWLADWEFRWQPTMHQVNCPALDGLR